MATTWTIPREWVGQTCVILGGGASLKGFDPSPLRGLCRVIGIKESGLTLAPWCDLLWWCDPEWLASNHSRLALHTGRYKCTRTDPATRHANTSPEDSRRILETLARTEIHLVPQNRRVPLVTAQNDGVAGICSGGTAINLAALFGASTVALLGFDMRQNGHWHDRTLREPPDHYARRFMPAMEKMAPLLRDAGVRVVNCTPHSALTCFERMDFEEFLSELRAAS